MKMTSGNRTATSLVGERVVKHLRPFADVATERMRLAQEGGLLELARGRGVVPILGGGSEALDLESTVIPESLEIPLDLNVPDPPRVQWRYMVTKHIAGLTVRELLAERPMNEALFARSRTQSIRWGSHLFKTLARLHEASGPKQLIHRDITPGNVLIDSSNQIWLNDFGLAHQPIRGGLPDNEILQGTKAWISPELHTGWQPSSASDVYQAALLTCTLLFDSVAESMAQLRPADAVEFAVSTLAALANGPQDSIRITPQAASTLASALLADPSKRPSARALTEALAESHRLLEKAQVAAVSTSIAPPSFEFAETPSAPSTTVASPHRHSSRPARRISSTPSLPE